MNDGLTREKIADMHFDLEGWVRQRIIRNIQKMIDEDNVFRERVILYGDPDAKNAPLGILKT